MDYKAEGVRYLPDEARFSHLLTLRRGCWTTSRTTANNASKQSRAEPIFGNS